MMNGPERQISSGNYQNPRKLFRNSDLQGIAMNDFLEKHNNEELSPEINIFNHVINDFNFKFLKNCENFDFLLLNY